MPLMKDVCNLGLGKLGASRVNNLSPPVSTLEAKCATEYPHWKASELRRRRWVFATALTKLSALTQQLPDAADGRIYQFNLPGDCLRPLRQKDTYWVQRGQKLFSTAPSITLEYIQNVPDNEMTDPSFVDVLACRVAYECAELATQSPGKKREAAGMLDRAVMEAGRLNAFMLEPHETAGNEASYTWDTARANPVLSGG